MIKGREVFLFFFFSFFKVHLFAYITYLENKKSQIGEGQGVRGRAKIPGGTKL